MQIRANSPLAGLLTFMYMYMYNLVEPIYHVSGLIVSVCMHDVLNSELDNQPT